MSDPTDSIIEILLIDDEDDFRNMTARSLRKRGVNVTEAASANEALKLIQSQVYDVAVCDLNMPVMSGIELLKEMKQSGSDLEIVMLTGAATVQTAVEAMKLGAYDYLTKPTDVDELLVIVRKAYEKAALRKENRQLRELVHRSRPTFDMIGESAPMRELFRLIERAGPTDKPILIQGESGTGKELVAQALHQASAVADKPMIVINCAALPEQLLESELFGHEKGAFTGASAAKPGLFELADGGTFFVDEIGELPLALQAKFLRVLENGSFRRVGSTREQRAKVRLLSATNRDLEKEVKNGNFREDLFYRIDVMTLRLPPLRERREDIPFLAAHFAGEDWNIEPRAMNALQYYQWPGNVRQLINAIERAKILSDDEIIHLEHLPKVVAEYGSEPPLGSSQEAADRGAVQKAHISEIMRRENGNKSRAARALGVTRRTLYRLLEKYELAEE